MNNFEDIIKKEDIASLKNNLLALKMVLEDKLKKEEKELLELYNSLPETIYNERLLREQNKK